MYLRTGETIHCAALGAVGEVHHHPHDSGVEGGRTGLQHRRPSASPGATVRIMLVPAVVPRVGGDPALAAVEAPLQHAALSCEGGRLARPLGRRTARTVAGECGRRPLFKTASYLGDFSVIWHLIGIGRAIIDPSTIRQSVTLSALIGAESLIVNQGLKRLFRRHSTDGVRRPALFRPAPIDIELSQRSCVGSLLRRGGPHHGEGNGWGRRGTRSPSSSPSAAPTCASTTFPTSSPAQQSVQYSVSSGHTCSPRSCQESERCGNSETVRYDLICIASE